MDSRNLTHKQACYLLTDVGRMLHYLNALCGRMQQLRWPLEDPVCREAMEAREAMQRLYTAAQGAGQPAPKPLRDE